MLAFRDISVKTMEGCRDTWNLPVSSLEYYYSIRSTYSQLLGSLCRCLTYLTRPMVIVFDYALCPY